MSFKNVTIWCLTAILFGLGCAQKRQASQVSSEEVENFSENTSGNFREIDAVQLAELEAKARQHRGDTLMIGFSKTPCFGTCPHFNFKVYESGFATYEGISYTKMKGMHSTWYTKDQMTKIVSIADSIGFQKMKDKYEAPVADLPSASIAVRLSTGLKRVMRRVGYPRALRGLEAEIEQLIARGDWKSYTPPADEKKN